MNNNYLAHYGVKGMRWGHRKTQKVSNKEIREDKINKQRELENEYFNKSKGAKYYDDAMKILTKYDLDGDDGGGGKPNTPDSARRKYLDLMEKSSKAYENDRISERAKTDTGKYLVEKYGQKRINDFNKSEKLRGAAITAGILAGMGTLYIGVPVLAVKGTKAAGRGIAKIAKKGKSFYDTFDFDTFDFDTFKPM